MNSKQKEAARGYPASKVARRLERNNAACMPGCGKPAAFASATKLRSQTDLAVENAPLRVELHRVGRKVWLLKKAAAYFATIGSDSATYAVWGGAATVGITRRRSPSSAT